MGYRKAYALLCLLPGCAIAPHEPPMVLPLLGEDSFVIAARYGTPTSYQYQGENLQLNYGNELWGCRVIFLLDKHQRVIGVASSGAKCGSLP